MVSPSLKRYGSALNRYKWPCLASFLGVVGLSTAVALQPPPLPQYRAEGVLVTTNSAPTAEEEAAQPQAQSVVSENALLSDRLLQTVAQDLATIPIAITPQTLRDHTRVTLEGNGEQGQQISVAFTWPDVDQAQVILNRMFQAIVDLSLETNQAQLQTIIDALERQLPAVESTLIAAEEDLKNYDRAQGLAIQAAQDGNLLTAIANGQEQQRQNDIALAAIQSQIQSLQQQLGLSPQEALTASALSADPVIAKLRSQILEAETQLDLLSPTLREAHPTLQDINTTLVTYDKLLEERAQEVIGGNGLVAFANVSQIRQKSALDPARAELASQLVALNNEREAILRQQQVLAQSTTQLTADYAQLPDLQLERARKVQQIELNRTLYNQIQAKRIDAQTAKAETLSSLAIAEAPATAPLPQTVLDPRLAISLGSLLGLILAGTLAQLLAMVDGTLHTRAELDAMLRNHRLLPGSLPTLNPVFTDDGGPRLLRPSSLQAYENLWSSLKSSHGQPETDGQPKVILITSSGQGEGKTTTAFNLGIAAARAGHRTLLLEVDWRYDSHSYLLGVEPTTATRLDPRVYYGEQSGDPAQPVPQVDNLFIVPSLGPQDSAATMLDAIEQFLVKAREQFERIILDAPPLSPDISALVLGIPVDGWVMVARANHTKWAELESGLDQLGDQGDSKEPGLLGVILNDAGKPRVSSRSDS